VYYVCTSTGTLTTQNLLYRSSKLTFILMKMKRFLPSMIAAKQSISSPEMMAGKTCQDAAGNRHFVHCPNALDCIERRIT